MDLFIQWLNNMRDDSGHRFWKNGRAKRKNTYLESL